MEELTLLEALCIVRTGFATEEEKRLLFMAEDVIEQESRRLHLIYRKALIENELKQINNK
jgi:hypothetical protein